MWETLAEWVCPHGTQWVVGAPNREEVHHARVCVSSFDVYGQARIVKSDPTGRKLTPLESFPIAGDEYTREQLPVLSPRSPAIGADSRILLQVECDGEIPAGKARLRIPIMERIKGDGGKFTKHLTEDTADNVFDVQGRGIESDTVASPRDDQGRRDFRAEVKPSDLPEPNPVYLSELERWWHA